MNFLYMFALLQVYELFRTDSSLLLESADIIKGLVSFYNLAGRISLAAEDKLSWPRLGLKRLHDRYRQRSLPCPTPCEYISEELGWWNWGCFDRKADWIGHGYWWRSMHGEAKSLDNMAGICIDMYT